MNAEEFLKERIEGGFFDDVMLAFKAHVALMMEKYVAHCADLARLADPPEGFKGHWSNKDPKEFRDQWLNDPVCTLIKDTPQGDAHVVFPEGGALDGASEFDPPATFEDFPINKAWAELDAETGEHLRRNVNAYLAQLEEAEPRKQLAEEFFTLDGHKTKPCSAAEWASMMRGRERNVGSSTVGESSVETDFLGTPHAGGMFETMVFGGTLDKQWWRSESWEEAEKLHARVVAMITAQLSAPAAPAQAKPSPPGSADPEKTEPSAPGPAVD